jgi:hypothetical protein
MRFLHRKHKKIRCLKVKLSQFHSLKNEIAEKKKETKNLDTDKKVHISANIAPKSLIFFAQPASSHSAHSKHTIFSQ